MGSKNYFEVVDNLPYLRFCYDIVVDVNFKFTDMTGYSRNDVVYKDIHVVLKMLLKGGYDNNILEEEIRDRDCYIFTKSLQYMYVQISIYNNSTNSDRTIIFIEKESLNIKENIHYLYQELIDSYYGVALFSIPDLTLLSANQIFIDSLKELYNNPQNSIGQRLEDIIPNWKDIYTENSYLNDLLSGEEIKNVRININENFIIEMSGKPIFDNNGDYKSVLISFRNFTKNVKHEELIKEQCNHVCNLLNVLDLPIIRLTYPDLVLMKINQKAYNELIKLDDLNAECKEKIKVGQKVTDIAPNLLREDSYKNIFQMKNTGKSLQSNQLFFMRSGDKAYYNIIFQPIFNTDGEMNEIVVAAMDVSKEVKEKEEIKNLLKIKDEFFSFITHEFKTPLAVINAAVQALEVLCSKELSDKAKKFIKQIKRSSLRQLRLINNLLDITKAESGYMKLHRKNFDIVLLTRLIIESVQQYCTNNGVNINFISGIDEKVIGIDDEKYERILLNLLSNAIKFTPTGKNIYVNIYLKKCWVCIEVKDEGIGIPKDNLKMIFNRFGQVDSSLTRKVEGTGIGLSLVKLLVKEMKGKIMVDSEIGIGTTFTIEIRDELCTEKVSEIQTSEQNDDRLIQAVAIEFSDIYGK